MDVRSSSTAALGARLPAPGCTQTTRESSAQGIFDSEECNMVRDLGSDRDMDKGRRDDKAISDCQRMRKSFVLAIYCHTDGDSRASGEFAARNSSV